MNDLERRLQETEYMEESNRPAHEKSMDEIELVLPENEKDFPIGEIYIKSKERRSVEIPELLRAIGIK